MTKETPPVVPGCGECGAEAVTDRSDPPKLLIETGVGPVSVRWMSSVEWMSAQGAGTEVWKSRGKALSRLCIRRINKEIPPREHCHRCDVAFREKRPETGFARRNNMFDPYWKNALVYRCFGLVSAPESRAACMHAARTWPVWPPRTNRLEALKARIGRTRLCAAP